MGRSVLEVIVEVTPKRGDGNLAWFLGKSLKIMVLRTVDVPRANCRNGTGSRKGCRGLFPVLFEFEVNDTMRHGEVGAQAPFVFFAELAGESLLDKSSNVGRVLVG